MSDNTAISSSRPPLPGRAVVLFLNFLLIILAYYQVKSASRSLIIEYWGADSFPVLWIASALVLLAFIGTYHRLVERHDRLGVVLGSLVCFMGLLVGFWLMLGIAGKAASAGFYVFVDIFSVILVEQLWSLTNTVTATSEGRRSYWFVGTGGLVGGIAGGVLAATLVKFTPMTTPDLLLSCALTLGITLALNLYMGRIGTYRELPAARHSPVAGRGWRALVQSRYLLLIAAALLCAQLAQPVVEFQFMKMVEAEFPELDARTAFISGFFGILGLVSVGVNLVVTPLIHRYLGPIAGMALQPLMLAAFSFAFGLYTHLTMAMAMKISDRGLSYSINRASKELLYIPVDPVHTYQAKAWIDMLGYRLFKVVGSALILAATQWLPGGLGAAGLGWITIGICVLWLWILALLWREYAFLPMTAPA
ncbi:MAG: Npt1/Npt2 family nucleotide transporter [Gammaproteobacteria bacterium]|nr:Npt1/Npt2 family nucleotide transporter [Gammaproteobacteria bacterium]